ncbi:cardiotrophin-1-like [Heptranchias perlo]|uniref:cardiotrophin-1-like n=1 Tax=Heptranchias perlo TaxID=212740 RepID=UPI0035599444
MWDTNSGQEAGLEPVDKTIERTYNLSVLLASESSGLLEMYTELQGFSETPPALPASRLWPPVAPGEGWARERLLRHYRGQCGLLARRLSRLLAEQLERSPGGRGFHRRMQGAVTGLEGLQANLSRLLSSLGPPEETEEEEEEETEEEEEETEEDGPASGAGHWEAKVKGYQVIAHYSHWIGRTARDLERLRDGLGPEA